MIPSPTAISLPLATARTNDAFRFGVRKLRQYPPSCRGVACYVQPREAVNQLPFEDAPSRSPTVPSASSPPLGHSKSRGRSATWVRALVCFSRRTLSLLPAYGSGTLLDAPLTRSLCGVASSAPPFFRPAPSGRSYFYTAKWSWRSREPGDGVDVGWLPVKARRQMGESEDAHTQALTYAPLDKVRYPFSLVFAAVSSAGGILVNGPTCPFPCRRDFRLYNQAG